MLGGTSAALPERTRRFSRFSSSGRRDRRLRCEDPRGRRDRLVRDDLRDAMVVSPGCRCDGQSGYAEVTVSTGMRRGWPFFFQRPDTRREPRIGRRSSLLHALHEPAPSGDLIKCVSVNPAAESKAPLPLRVTTSPGKIRARGAISRRS